MVALSALSTLGILLAWWSLRLYRRWETKRLIPHLSHFPNAHSRYADVDGVRLHYIVAGSTGPDLILLHGIGANIYCWRKLIPLMAKRHRVWALDLMGFGLSDKPAHRTYDAKSQARLIRAFMAKHRIRRAVLMGSSMGAAIATQVAALHPKKVSHLVLCNPSIEAPVVLDLRRVRMLAPLFHPLVNRFTVAQILKRFIYAPGAEFTAVDVDVYLKPYVEGNVPLQSFIQSIDILVDKEIWKAAAEIKVPTLLLWGARDALIPAKLGSKLKAAFPACSLKIHPSAAHHIQEEVPEWLAEEVQAFIEISCTPPAEFSAAQQSKGPGSS